MFRNSRLYLLFSAICAGLFAVNLITGKIEVSYRIDMFFHVEGVPEFLLLLLSVIFFVVSTLIRERADNSHST